MIELIERYVWSPDLLTKRELEHVREIIDRDDSIRDFWEFLSAFRDEMHTDLAELPPQVKTFARSLYLPPRRIPLHMKREADRDARTKTAIRGSMAAATPARNSRYRSLGSMLNREEGILARFLLDSEEGVVRGYILSSPGVDAGSSLVSFGSRPHPVFPNRDGMFSFPASWVHATGGLADLDVELLLPVLTHTIEGTPETFTMHHPGSGDLMASFTTRDNTLFPSLPATESFLVTISLGEGDATCLQNDKPVPCPPGVTCIIRAYDR